MGILKEIRGKDMEYVSITWKMVGEDPEAIVRRSGVNDRPCAEKGKWESDEHGCEAELG